MPKARKRKMDFRYEHAQCALDNTRLRQNPQHWQGNNPGSTPSNTYHLTLQLAHDKLQTYPVPFTFHGITSEVTEFLLLEP
eukprot:2426584-Ditylum_brightwellii.AAC.1